MLVRREIEERAGQFQQPTVLHRVAQRLDARDQPANFFLGVEAGFFDLARAACRPSGTARCSSGSRGCRPAFSTRPFWARCANADR